MRILESRSPITYEVLGTVPIMSAEEVRAEVDTARLTASEWGALPTRVRAAQLRRIRREFADRAGLLASTISRETGKPMADAYIEVSAACMMLSYAARVLHRTLRPERVQTWPVIVKRAWVEYSPLGVVGVISPWNYPLAIPMQVLPWAIAAGNAVVLKPSELAPLTGQLIGRVVADAGVDLVRVVTGDGQTGAALVAAGVDKLVFTGSTATGRRILSAAAEHLTPVVMELGGKDAMVVCDDADITRAARTAVGGAFANAGQTCMAVERVFVSDGVYDAFVDEVLRVTARLELGTGARSHVGPLTQDGHLEVIQRRLADAVAAGAKIRLGGGRRSDLGGAWLEPTVVTDVDPTMELMRAESFAPVLSIMRVRGADEAVRLANDCDYGLSASVFSRDRRLARHIASRMQSGGVNINDAVLGAGIPGLPFGGEKCSGLGRLQGKRGLWEFSRSRSVTEGRLGRGPSLAAVAFTGRRPDPRVLRSALRLVYGSPLRLRRSRLAVGAAVSAPSSSNAE